MKIELRNYVAGISMNMFIQESVDIGGKSFDLKVLLAEVYE